MYSLGAFRQLPCHISNSTSTFEFLFTPGEKGRGGAGGRGSYFPYILLHEIQTMFSQLAKGSAKVLPAELCSDHAHYVKIHRSTVHSRPQSPSFLGHVVGKRRALTSGRACAENTNTTAHAHNGFLSLTAPLVEKFYFLSSLRRVASLGCFGNAPLHSTWIH